MYYTGQSKKTFNLLAGGSTELQVVTSSYDFADRPLETTRPDGGWVKTGYWDNWLALATSQQVESGKVRFKFEQMDGAGRAYKKASDHPDGVSGKFAGQVSVFDKVGQVQDSSNVLAIDGSWIASGEDAGKSFLWTNLTRDELARLKLVTLPDNNTRELEYEGCGCAGNNTSRLTDELGHATVTKNDPRGRLIEAIEENPNNLFVPYSKAEYVYDELDRLTAINHSGQPLAYQGPRPVQTRTFSYDGYGRMTSETTPEGGTVTYTYTANDQVWQVTNQRPVTTIHTYNSRGLLTNVSYSDSTPAVTYSYDAYGARTTMTDGEGATNYTYNSYRQLQSETRTFTNLANNSYTLNYTYNQGDQVKSANYFASITAQPGAPFTAGPFFGIGMNTRTISGTVTNPQGQPMSGVTLTLSGGQSGTTTTNSSGQYTFSGLPNGLDYTVTPTLNGYVFDPSSRTYLGLKINITDANFTGTLAQTITFDKTINYAYNAVGALGSIGTNLIGTDPTNATNVLNTVSFRASGALKQLNYGNGRRLTMGYNDQRSQPTSMIVDRTNNSADKVVDYAYQYYDANGKNNNRIRQITDNIETAYSTTYTYDNYNRLSNATANAFSRNYQYDEWGNVKNFSGLTLNYATNGSGAPSTNRLLSDSQGGSYTYDAAGNQTAGAGQSYSYDGANRLKEVGTGGANVYGYDGDGKRVKKTEGGATVYYVSSTVLGQTAMEVSSASVQTSYVYHNGRIAAQMNPDGQFYWRHGNHLGSTRAMTDASGNLSYKAQHDPYGQVLSEWSASGNNGMNKKKFTDYERDASGLDYAAARMYNSTRGKFLQSDPAGMKSVKVNRPESLNRYAYSGNDPVNNSDPTGLDFSDWLRFFAESACKSQGFGSFLGLSLLPGDRVGFLCEGREIFSKVTKQMLEALGDEQRPKRKFALNIERTRQQNLVGQHLKFPNGTATNEVFWGHGIGILYSLADSDCNPVSSVGWSLKETITLDSVKVDGKGSPDLRKIIEDSIKKTNASLESEGGKWADAVGMLLGSLEQYRDVSKLPNFEVVLKQKLVASHATEGSHTLGDNSFTLTNYGTTPSFGAPKGVSACEPTVVQ